MFPGIIEAPLETPIALPEPVEPAAEPEPRRSPGTTAEREARDAVALRNDASSDRDAEPASSPYLATLMVVVAAGVGLVLYILRASR